MSDSPAAILYDASGNPIKVIDIVVGAVHNRYVGVGMVQDVLLSINNSTDVQLAPGASFTGTADTTLGVVGLQVTLMADQPIRVSVEQSVDGSNWFGDPYDLPASYADGRTTQAVAAYMRVVVTNLGAATTTSFVMQTFLCPSVEALPRALTPRGALKLSQQTVGATPDPTNFSSFAVMPALTQDADGHLVVRGPALTDEASYRTDFSEGSQYVALSGTCYFRTGIDHIVGVGTNFLGEVKIGQYIKLSTDSESVQGSVLDVYSDTDLTLESPYSGSTGSGTGQVAQWLYATGAGGSITITASEIRLVSGTTSGSITSALQVGDYLPYTLGVLAKVNARRANQEISLGFLDDASNLVGKQAAVVFDGTDNTIIKFRTAFSTTDIQETTVTMPFGATTDNYNTYEINVSMGHCYLWINNVRVVDHTLHIPGPYDLMDIRLTCWNTGVPAGSTTFSVDALWFQNFNRLEIALSTKGDPLPVQSLQATVPTSSNVAAAVADTALLAFNSYRLGATIYNDSTARLYLKFGTGASTTSFTVKLNAGDYYELPYGYQGIVNGYWSVANGAARITEVT